jgi:predicted dehydrogenase
MLRTGVIGTGYLGKFHAEKYSKLKNSELKFLVDTDLVTAKALAKKYQCTATNNYHDLINQVDAVSIVTPTSSHYDIAKFFLEHGVHVLVEKPMTVTLAEAQTLIDLAETQKLILQVGYLERFNPIIMKALPTITTPKFIESTRIMGFNPRNKDVNVILDLMIHDIDLIQSIVDSEIKSIDTSGIEVLSNDLDIASARLHFMNNCVANVTASRISLKSERKLRIFQEDAYFSLDLQNKNGIVCRKGSGEMFPGIPNIERQTLKVKDHDALLTEIDAFLTAILTHTPPKVTGNDGKRSLAVALAMTEQIKQHNTSASL